MPHDARPAAAGGEEHPAQPDLRSALLVQAAHAEPDAPPETAAELGEVLESMAGWLELDRVEVVRRGDLAPALGALRRAA